MDDARRAIPWVLSITAAFWAAEGLAEDAAISFRLERPRRVSLAVYDRGGRLVRELARGVPYEAGEHSVRWDGLDRMGRAVAAGEYEWRLLESNGFTAKYLTTLGVNPPSGPTGKFQHQWVGNHGGAGTVAVDGGGLYVGAAISEGLLMLKQSHDGTNRVWQRMQYYEGGRLTRMAATEGVAFALQPHGKLRRLNPETGAATATWDVKWDDEVPVDVDVHGRNLALCYAGKKAVRWLDRDSGAVLATAVELAEPTNLTALADAAKGTLLVTTSQGIEHVEPSGARVVVPAGDLGALKAIDVDRTNGDIYVAAERPDREVVLRFDRNGKLVKSYGGKPRPMGRYDAALFKGLSDVAADGRGHVYVTEPWGAPRRTAKFDAETGRLVDEWYGAQSFYVSVAVDRDDPTSVWGCAQEGYVIHYRLDYDTGEWTVHACYATGRLEDSLFPFTGKWRPVRADGSTYLVFDHTPAVLRVDEERGRVVPVSITGEVLGGGRRAWQFGGTGPEGFPKPFAAAAARAGFDAPSKAPKFHAWTDRNTNGRADADEFTFSDDKPEYGSIAGFAYDDDWNAVFAPGGLGNPLAFSRMPRRGRLGDPANPPTWSWSEAKAGPPLPADLHDTSSIRCLHVGDDGSVYVAVQSGLLIRGHGQYEGGAWPYQSIRRARLLKYDSAGGLRFCVGRHAKSPNEVGTGCLYYPMNLTGGPKGTVVVSDQALQPATVWTEDGLYAGSLLDHRADDGRPDDLYRTHSDDMQGVEIVTLDDGRVFWLMTVQGMQLVYEVTGWESLAERRGSIARPVSPKVASGAGTGLAATWYGDAEGKAVAFRTTEAPLYFEPFGRPPHEKMPAAPHRVDWTGFLEAPRSESYTFDALFAGDESVRVWVNETLVLARGVDPPVRESIPLTTAKRSPIRIEYVNGKDRPELKLLWSSVNLDPQRLPATACFATATGN